MHIQGYQAGRRQLRTTTYHRPALPVRCTLHTAHATCDTRNRPPKPQGALLALLVWNSLSQDRARRAAARYRTRVQRGPRTAGALLSA